MKIGKTVLSVKVNRELVKNKKVITDAWCEGKITHVCLERGTCSCYFCLFVVCGDSCGVLFKLLSITLNVVYSLTNSSICLAN